MKIMLRGGSAEITEKKSRFIANAKPVASQDEANEFLASMRKQYWDARHNCSACVTGYSGEFMHCSDDGEPSGTAGRPILSVLTGSGITGACIVVTRYFGGTLLGTGGLVRAYTQAARGALAASAVCERIDGIRIRFKTGYSDLGAVQRLLDRRELPVTDTSYTDAVEIETIVPSSEAASLKNAVTQQTNARAVAVLEQPVKYVVSDGETIIL